MATIGVIIPEAKIIILANEWLVRFLLAVYMTFFNFILSSVVVLMIWCSL